MLELGDIQGDIVIGLQKDFEDLVFFKIIDRSAFKTRLKQYGIGRITTAQVAHQRESAIHRPHKLGPRTRERFAGLNLGFTQHGLDQLVGDGRPRLDLSFEKGADNPDTITALSDPPKSAWLRHFVSERIDGVFLLTGPNRSLVASHSNQLRALLSSSIRIVYSEIGNTRPGTE